MNRFDSPLTLLGAYYSPDREVPRTHWLWKRMNTLLSWDNMIERGYQADLAPLLYWIGCRMAQGNGSGSVQADSLMQRLEPFYRASLARNLVLLEEKNRIVKALAGKGIPVIPLKGAHLAETVYENMACRPMGDLDLLIQKSDLEESVATLTGMGYNRVPASPYCELLHITVSRRVHGVPVRVELHTALSKDIFPARFDLKPIWTNRSLPSEYQVVYLSWHALRHGIERLIWLCDLSELAMSNQPRPIEWRQVSTHAQTSNAPRQLAFCLHLMHILLGCTGNNHCVHNGKGTLQRHVSTRIFLGLHRALLSQQEPLSGRKFLFLFQMRPVDIIGAIYKHRGYRQYLRSPYN